MPRTKKTPAKRGPATSRQPKPTIATVKLPRSRKRKSGSEAESLPARKQRRIDSYTTVAASSTDEGSPVQATARKGKRQAQQTTTTTAKVRGGTKATVAASSIDEGSPVQAAARKGKRQAQQTTNTTAKVRGATKATVAASSTDEGCPVQAAARKRKRQAQQSTNTTAKIRGAMKATVAASSTDEGCPVQAAARKRKRQAQQSTNTTAKIRGAMKATVAASSTDEGSPVQAAARKRKRQAQQSTNTTAKIRGAMKATVAASSTDEGSPVRVVARKSRPPKRRAQQTTTGKVRGGGRGGKKKASVAPDKPTAINPRVLALSSGNSNSDSSTPDSSKENPQRTSGATEDIDGVVARHSGSSQSDSRSRIGSTKSLRFASPLKSYNLVNSPGKSPLKSRGKGSYKSPNKSSPLTKQTGGRRKTARKSLTFSSDNRSDGEGGGGGKGNDSMTGVQEITVPGHLAAKWTPISKAARTLLSDAFMSASQVVLNELSGSVKRQTEQELLRLTKSIEEELKTAVAPKRARKKSYSSLNREVLRLKDSCLATIDKNSEMEQKLEELQSLTADRLEKCERLQAAVKDTHLPVAVTRRSRYKLPDPPPEGNGEGSRDNEQFLEYVMELASVSRLAAASMQSH